MWKILNGKSGEQNCAHCHNSGNVVLDYYEPVTGAPCPMCMVGFNVNQDRKEKNLCYWHMEHGDEGIDVHQWSWNHGLSIDHCRRCRECGDPAIGQRCTYCKTKGQTQAVVA